jgi:hypothetical protein
VTSVIVQTLLNYLPATRRSPNGWTSFNAPCCAHRGHSGDGRRRGGIKLVANGVVFHCFNCTFSTGYTVGGSFGIKFRRLLSWLGVGSTEINALKIQALRERSDSLGLDESDTIPEIQIEPRELPAESELLDSSKHAECYEYLERRSIDPNSYTYFVSSELPRRIIVPFTHQQYLVGYTARTIGTAKPKYIQSLGMPYIFGEVFQKPNWNWCPVVEGVFDAISIGGVSVLGNEVSEAQAELLDQLNRKIVVVPDQDSSGESLVQAALDYGWSVSFPDWPPDVKDVNDAVMRWGPLFVTRQIWQARVTGTTQIKLRLKLNKKYN